MARPTGIAAAWRGSAAAPACADTRVRCHFSRAKNRMINRPLKSHPKAASFVSAAKSFMRGRRDAVWFQAALLMARPPRVTAATPSMCAAPYHWWSSSMLPIITEVAAPCHGLVTKGVAAAARVGAYPSRRSWPGCLSLRCGPITRQAQVAASNSICEHFHRGALANMLSKVGDQSRRRRSSAEVPSLGPHGAVAD